MDVTQNEFMFELIIYIPVNNFSVLLMNQDEAEEVSSRLAKGHNKVPPVSLEPGTPWSSLALYHCATLRSSHPKIKAKCLQLTAVLSTNSHSTTKFVFLHILIAKGHDEPVKYTCTIIFPNMLN